MMVIQDFAKMVMIRNLRWPPCPYKVKNHGNDFLSRTTGPVWLIFCLKHMGHLPIKELKLFGSHGSNTGPSWSSYFFFVIVVVVVF